TIDGAGSVAWSRDGKRLAYATRSGTTGAQATVQLVDVAGTPVTQLAAWATDLRFLRDGKTLVWRAGDALEYHDATTLQLGRSVTLGKNVTAAVLSNDETFAVVADKQRVWRLDLATNKVVAFAIGHPRYGFALAPDDRRLTVARAEGAGTGQATTFDTTTGAMVPLDGHADAVSRVACLADGAVTVGREQGVVWESDGRPRATLAHADAILSLDVSRDGTRIVTAGEDKTAIVWDAKTGRKLVTLAGFDDWVGAVFLADGRIVTDVFGTPALVIHSAAGRVARTLAIPHGDSVGLPTLSPDGTTLVATSTVAPRAYAWNTKTFGAPRTIKLRKQAARARYTPDGRTILLSSTSSEPQSTLDARTWVERAESKLPYLPIAVSRDSTWIVSTSVSPTAFHNQAILKFPSLAPLRTLGVDGAVAAACPDGKRLVTGGEDGTAIVWSIAALLKPGG
ncbi:MAG: hypothetical protein H0T79_15080, partial [Deltaproteobacteria bacterium]|nr:hypothetical protein [Deltaproteobacteria bacterium]